MLLKIENTKFEYNVHEQWVIFLLKNQQKSTIIYEGVDQSFKDQAELKARICWVWQSASNQETVLKAILQFWPCYMHLSKPKRDHQSTCLNSLCNLLYDRFIFVWMRYYEAKFNIFLYRLWCSQLKQSRKTENHPIFVR